MKWEGDVCDRHQTSQQLVRPDTWYELRDDAGLKVSGVTCETRHAAMYTRCHQAPHSLPARAIYRIW